MPACGTTQMCTVAGEATWNQRAAMGSPVTAPPAMISIGRGAPLISPAAVYCTHSMPVSRTPVMPCIIQP